MRRLPVLRRAPRPIPLPPEDVRILDRITYVLGGVVLLLLGALAVVHGLM